MHSTLDTFLLAARSLLTLHDENNMLVRFLSSHVLFLLPIKASALRWSALLG